MTRGSGRSENERSFIHLSLVRHFVPSHLVATSSPSLHSPRDEGLEGRRSVGVKEGGSGGRLASEGRKRPVVKPGNYLMKRTYDIFLDFQDSLLPLGFSSLTGGLMS